MYNFKEEELLKIGDKFIEEESAFPDLQGNQTAIMLKWNGEKWVVSGWGCVIDGEKKEVLGWESLVTADKQAAIEFVNDLMENIQNDA